MMSATYEAMADLRGCVTPALTKCHTDLAAGEISLVISGCAHIDPRGYHHPTMLSLLNEDVQQSLGALAHAMHCLHTPLAVQLCHSGGMSKPALVETAATMSLAGIERVVENFARAARAWVSASTRCRSTPPGTASSGDSSHRS